MKCLDFLSYVHMSGIRLLDGYSATGFRCGGIP